MRLIDKETPGINTNGNRNGKNQIWAWREKTSSPSWELRTASPRGRYGERRQRDPCLKHTYKKTPPVGQRQPMTSLPARPQYKGRQENTSSTSFVFTDCFVWSVHSGKSTVFILLSWRALAKRLRSVWIHVLVIWHPMTHTIFASFVWARLTHAMSLRGKSVCTVSFFLWKISALVCPSFRGKRGSRLLPAIRDPPLPRHGDKLNCGVRSWIWS